MDERLEEIASLYVLEALTPEDRKTFETAIGRDVRLQSLVAALRAVRDAVAGAVPPLSPPPQIRNRILADLDHRDRKKPRAAAVKTAPVMPLAPVEPVKRAEPVEPVPPVEPVAPAEPLRTVEPEEPAGKIEPPERLREAKPAESPEPEEPVTPVYAPSLSMRREASSPPSDLLGFWLPWSITAVVVVLAVNWYMDRSDLRKSAARQHAAIEELDQLTESLRTATNNLEQTVVTLNAASKVDDVRVALLTSASSDFPKPAAVCLWDNQQQSGILVAQSLTPLTPDRDYQLWMVDPQYLTPVNAGLFQPDKNGNVRVHFKPDKAINSAMRFTVTLEPKGGSTAPTYKNMVLVGG